MNEVIELIQSESATEGDLQIIEESCNTSVVIDLAMEESDQQETPKKRYPSSPVIHPDILVIDEIKTRENDENMDSCELSVPFCQDISANSKVSNVISSHHSMSYIHDIDTHMPNEKFGTPQTGTNIKSKNKRLLDDLISDDLSPFTDIASGNSSNKKTNLKDLSSKWGIGLEKLPDPKPSDFLTASPLNDFEIIDDRAIQELKLSKTKGVQSSQNVLSDFPLSSPTARKNSSLVSRSQEALKPLDTDVSVENNPNEAAPSVKIRRELEERSKLELSRARREKNNKASLETSELMNKDAPDIIELNLSKFLDEDDSTDGLNLRSTPIKATRTASQPNPRLNKHVSVVLPIQRSKTMDASEFNSDLFLHDNNYQDNLKASLYR